MKTKAVRLYGASDLRLEEFDLPPVKDDEILVKVVSDSICMSTYKCAMLGEKHKRVPKDVALHPTIMGHEFAGDIIEVGKLHRDRFHPGMKFTIQPALNYKGTMWSPGYSYQYCGGNATYCILPHEIMELDCLLEYKGKAYFEASLAEPMSCCIGAFHACYHTKMGVYHHVMEPKKNGTMLLLAAAGPMGLGALDYALQSDWAPSVLVVADIDADRLARAEQLFRKDGTLNQKTCLKFINLAGVEKAAELLKSQTGGVGYDDVFVFTPVQKVVELGSAVLGRDGCLNFFAGPTDNDFCAKLNFYDVHYNSTHVMGTTGGNTKDMLESLALTAQGRINPAVMLTHVGGLDAAVHTTLNLPNITGGKKLIYPHITMPLTALEDLREKGKKEKRFYELAEIVEGNKGLWCLEAEQYLLEHWAP